MPQGLRQHTNVMQYSDINNGAIMKRKDLFTMILRLLIIISSFSVFILHSHFLWILIALQTLILIYFINADIKSFAHSFFWTLFLVSILILPWPLSFIIPIVIYLIIIFLFKNLKKEINWLRFGEINYKTIIFMIPTIILSSLALILWVYLLKPDLSDLKNMMPTNNIFCIVIIGLLFSIFNSIWEEVILKGILWNGIEGIISNVIFIILFQAVLFGILHLNGFPRGVIGAILAGVYGVLIGFIRKYSNGLLAPIITHFFADATIFGILIALNK